MFIRLMLLNYMYNLSKLGNGGLGLLSLRKIMSTMKLINDYGIFRSCGIDLKNLFQKPRFKCIEVTRDKTIATSSGTLLGSTNPQIRFLSQLVGMSGLTEEVAKITNPNVDLCRVSDVLCSLTQPDCGKKQDKRRGQGCCHSNRLSIQQQT